MSLTLPVVVFSETQPCTNCATELTLYSDGIRAYAVSTDLELEVITLVRDVGRISTDCPADECVGSYVWELSTEGTWTACPVARSMVAYGEKMDVA